MSYKVPIASTTSLGSIKVGSGLSVSAGTVSASLGLANYGFFTSTATQTNSVANAINLVTYNAAGPVSGISITGDNALTVVNAGTYTKLFTLEVAKTAGGTSVMSTWLRVNGVDVPGSRQDLALINTLSTIFVSGNYTLNIQAGGNTQMCWSSSDTTVKLLTIPAAVTPTRPTGSSVKVTLTRIS